MGGLRPHYYCLPVLKREVHRQALVAAATSGSPRFFLGTDSAPHAAALKEQSVCGAGCFTAPAALELYAEAFDAAGALDKLEGLCQPPRPGLLRPAAQHRHRDTLRREPWTLPETLPFGDATIKPLRAGETLNWKLHEPADRVMLLIDADNVSVDVMDQAVRLLKPSMARCTCAGPTAPPRARSSTSRPSSGCRSSPWSTWRRARTAPTSRWRSTPSTWCWPSGPTWW
jgi:hypothetical protein